jgi:hypothetical protein
VGPPRKSLTTIYVEWGSNSRVDGMDLPEAFLDDSSLLLALVLEIAERYMLDLIMTWYI